MEYMSEEGVSAVADANDRRADREEWASVNGRNYVVSLNTSDFRNLLAALLFVWQRCQDSDPYPDLQTVDDLPEWTGRFVTGIAETLGVEFT